MQRLRALVADDDPDMLHFVGDLVAETGADVTVATTGHELLDRIAEDGPFDFIVTDIGMPWMTGVQVMQSARTAGLPIPVIVMTGMRGTKVLEQVEALGGYTALLLKPFSMSELTAALHAAIAEVEARPPRAPASRSV